MRSMRALLAVWLAGTSFACSATLDDPPGERGFSGSCNVDVLFAVDNSGSTSKEQDALRDWLPSAVTELRRLGDFRAGLVDGCLQSATLHTSGASGDCDFDGGHPWVQASSADAADELRCVADIDSRQAACRGNDDDEQPVSTAAAALEPAWSRSGAPNAGFAREGAVLVVIAITDEDEQPMPAATAQAVHDRLVAAKGNNRVVFAGAGGASDCDGPYGSARDASTLKGIAAQFGARGMFWDLCGGDLERGLDDAIELAASVCE